MDRTDKVYKLLGMRWEALMTCLESDGFDAAAGTVDPSTHPGRLAVEHGQYSIAQEILKAERKVRCLEADGMFAFVLAHERAMAAFHLTQDEIDLVNDQEPSITGPLLSEWLLHRCLMQLRVARNWLKARKAIMKRWILEYWREIAAQSSFERDRQVEVQAMTELMPAA